MTASESSPAEWQQPTRVELLEQVRQILTDNPERHYQNLWTTSRFGLSGTNGFFVEAIRRVFRSPIPDEPEDPDNPVCGTQACIAGWTVILGTPPGSALIHSDHVRLPDDSQRSVSTLAAELLELSDRQASWLFAGDRERPELIVALGELIDDPHARLDHSPVYTVVVFDENGDEVHSVEVEVDADDTSHRRVEYALESAYNRH